MKPILFNTEMVRAILGNRKTVTRRVVKPQPRMVYYDGELKDSGDTVRDGVPLWILIAEGQNGTLEQIVPPYQPGSILYVRETWQYAYDLDGNEQPIDGTGRYLYAADGEPEPFGFWVNPDGTHRYSMPWCPSIHMPREAARIFLRVTNVRVERLQDITEEGARAEGVEPIMITADVDKPDNEREWHEWGPALPGFITLWDTTIKPADRALYGWEANPYVWVIEFERCEKPQDE